MGGAYSTRAEMKNSHKTELLILMGIDHCYRSLHVKEVGSGGVDWIQLAQDGLQWRALVNTVMNLRGTYKKDWGIY